mgnify:CR=1 FL=1
MDNQNINIEILGSKKELENLLSTEINHFSFPFGKIPIEYYHNNNEFFKKNFDTVMTTGYGYLLKNSTIDYYNLPRIFISPQYGKKDFEALVNGLDYFSKKLG